MLVAPQKARSWRHPILSQKNYLVVEYVVNKRCARDIGEEHGVSKTRVLYWLRKHHIPRRSVSAARRLLLGPPWTPDMDREYKRIWRWAFPEHTRAIQKRSTVKHPETARAAHKRYRQRHPERILAKARRWRANNLALARVRDRAKSKRQRLKLAYRIKDNLRRRINDALAGRHKSDHTLELVGCSIGKLREHIQKQFTPGMYWNNYGRWHLDHIIPLSVFSLEKPDHQKLAFHYTNMQPLWAGDNLRKNAKVPADFLLPIEVLV